MLFPRYADRCRPFEITKNLICYICPESVEHQQKVNWYKHIRDPEHLLMIERFNKSFCETKFLVICKHCSKSFSKRETSRHAISHQLSPWYKPENMYTIFLKNFIAQMENQYYCHLCKDLFSLWHAALNHVDDPKHQRLQRIKIHEDVNKMSPICAQSAQSLINHSVFPTNSLIFECMICHTGFSGYKNFNDHINGKSHRSHEALFLKSLKNEAATISASASVDERKKKSRRIFRGSNGSTTSKSSNAKNSKKSKSNKTVAAAVTPLSSSSKATPLPNKIITPQRQFTRVIRRTKGGMTKSTCQICGEKVDNGVYLHAHLTSHFWKRFHQCSSREKDQLNIHAGTSVRNELIMNNVDENSNDRNSSYIEGAVAPLEKIIKKQLSKTNKDITKTRNDLSSDKDKNNVIVNNSEIYDLEAPITITSKDTSRLQFYEILNKKLAPKIIPQIHQPLIIDKSIIAHASSMDTINSESSIRKSSPKRSGNSLKRKPDIQRGRVNYNYIYDIDNKQLENIKLGIILSFTKSENTIYCMICRVIVKKSVQDMHEHLCNIQHNNYLEQMHHDHLNFITFPNSFSDLELALQFIEETSDSCVTCWACNEAIENLIDILKWHIETDSHKDNCRKLAINSGKLFESIKTRMFRDWFNVQYYWCVICNTRFTSEACFTQHLESVKHEKTYGKYKKFEDFIYDFCPICATLWYGFRCTFGYHNQCKMHKYLLKDNFYHVTELPNKTMELFINPERMCDQVLFKIDRDIENDKTKVQILVNDLTEAAHKKCHHAKLHPFGSRITGLGSKNSDLDIFIDCNKKYFKGYSPNEIIVYLKAIENALKNNSETWKINQTITVNVRIPIIKTYHKSTGIECDISFTNGLATENTKLIKNYIGMNPLCRKLIVFMKKWIVECDLSGRNGLTSYAVAWMVIYYLQSKNILPSVAKLIELNGESRVIAGWETGVTEDFIVSSGEFNFIELLKGLFITYSQFDYRYDVICPLMGRPIKKVSFETSDLPSAMNPYMKYLSEVKERTKFRTDSEICIQDPFELCINLTERVQKFLVHRLRFFSSISAQMLENPP